MLDIRVPEGVRVDVGKTVAGREAIQPVTNAVRVHWLPIVLYEHIAGIVPAVTVCQPHFKAFPFMKPQELQGFLWKVQCAGVPRFGFA